MLLWKSCLRLSCFAMLKQTILCILGWRENVQESLHDLARLSHTNLSSQMTVWLCIICLLQCSEVPLALGEYLTED